MSLTHTHTFDILTVQVNISARSRVRPRVTTRTLRVRSSLRSRLSTKIRVLCKSTRKKRPKSMIMITVCHMLLLTIYHDIDHLDFILCEKNKRHFC
jgi:hypothetical protein